MITAILNKGRLEFPSSVPAKGAIFNIKGCGNASVIRYYSDNRIMIDWCEPMHFKNHIAFIETYNFQIGNEDEPLMGWS